MQTNLLPTSGSDPSSSLQSLHNDGQLGEAADLLWKLLLKHLQRKSSKCKKGERSHSLTVNKADVLRVRMTSRSVFWEKAKGLDKLGGSGSLLFWNALHFLMVGDPDKGPRVIMEGDEIILGVANTRGVCKVAFERGKHLCALSTVACFNAIHSMNNSSSH